MTTPSLPEHQCTVCGKKQSESPTPLIQCEECHKQTYCSDDCTILDWRSHKDLCKSRRMLNGEEPLHPQFNRMIKLFIDLKSPRQGEDPIRLMMGDAGQLSIRMSETFIELQIFRALRREVEKNGDKRAELLMFNAMRRDRIVSQCVSRSIPDTQRTNIVRVLISHRTRLSELCTR